MKLPHIRGKMMVFFSRLHIQLLFYDITLSVDCAERKEICKDDKPTFNKHLGVGWGAWQVGTSGSDGWDLGHSLVPGKEVLLSVPLQ